MNKWNLKKWHIFILLSFLLLFLFGCAGIRATVTADPGEEFKLGIGESSRISGEDLVILFNEVTGDSRCPSDVTCVWAGEATCSVTITSKNKEYPTDLIVSGASDQNEKIFEDHLITFSLEPYPKSDSEILQGDYILTVTVTDKTDGTAD